MIDEILIDRVEKAMRTPIHQVAAKIFIKHAIRPKWIVDHDGCLGLRIFGVNLVYYKHPEPMVSFLGGWRTAEKREFGEVVRSIK